MINFNGMKYLLIVNAISGQGRSLAVLDDVRAIMNEKKLDYRVSITKYPGHAKEIAQTVKSEDDTTIISLGGDGTIYEIINGINDYVPLIILPTGSGNDFNRVIYQNRELPISEILKLCLDGKACKVDLGQITVDGEQRRFLNTTSIGLDADINALASSWIRAKKYNKDKAYNKAIVKLVLRHKFPTVTISIDDKEPFTKTCTIINTMNGEYYGNGRLANPLFDLQDGLFEFCYVDPLSIPGIAIVFPKYEKGGVTDIKKAHLCKCKKIHLHSDTPFNFQSDGENGMASDLQIRVLEGKLLLMVPDDNQVLN